MDYIKFIIVYVLLTIVSKAYKGVTKYLVLKGIQVKITLSSLR